MFSASQLLLFSKNHQIIAAIRFKFVSFVINFCTDKNKDPKFK